MSAGRFRFAILLLLAFGVPVAVPSEGLIDAGGGATLAPPADCIPPAERMRALEKVAAWRARHGLPEARGAVPASYTFFPQAGLFWGDVFGNNFVDLDPTSGVLDYDCSDYTYDGHRGIDSDIVTWTQQSLGVPVYAALDGVVTATEDGNFDMQTTWDPDNRANYVIVHHGGTHYTWYWHLKNGSVAVAVDDVVVAGHQLGLTASSGFSTGPHLHFESRWDDAAYEPFAGSCRPGDSRWVEQPPFVRDFYVREFVVTHQSLSGWAGPPVDTTRTPHFEIGTNPIRFWKILHNLPASSTLRVRFLRPDGSARFTGSTVSFGNSSAFRWSWWWRSYSIDFDEVGTWTLEYTINGEVVVTAPFEVYDPFATPTPGENRAPYPVTASFEPAAPRAGDVVRCRIDSFATIKDPDFDQVSYRYEWRVNGDLVRDVTIAALGDVIRRDLLANGDTLTCTVTPTDGSAAAPSTEASVVVGADLPPGVHWAVR